MVSPAHSDPNEALWEASFKTYYDVLFEEMATESLITGWSRFDDVTKVLVSLTAGGSVVSGLTLWNQAGYRSVFVALSAVAALLSVLSTSLTISARIKAHSESNSRFTSLRVDLETFRLKMRFNPNFDTATFSKEFEDSRKRFGEAMKLRSTDTFRTNRFDMRVQKRENTRLKNEIIQQERTNNYVKEDSR